DQGRHPLPRAAVEVTRTLRRIHAPERAEHRPACSYGHNPRYHDVCADPRQSVDAASRRQKGQRVFERFTERARQVVVLAQDEARALKHNSIGTEHILLGLLREEEGLAARVLESLDITVEEVRAQVARIVGQGDEVTSGQIPFTPRAKKVLELALREALSL